MAPGAVNLMILLSDGTVLASENDDVNDFNAWFRLTPDSQGSYANGTWTQAAPMNDSRLFFSSQLLRDGRLFVAGGEYGSGSGTAEVYDPVANTWTRLPIPTRLFDPNSPSALTGSDGSPVNQSLLCSCSALLSDGSVLLSPVFPKDSGGTLIYDPSTNKWSAGPVLVSNDDQDEASWVKLPDDSILTIDPCSTTTERYIPATNSWVSDTPVPIDIYDSVGCEMGPGVLLANGKAMFFGGTGHTAIYTPTGTASPGRWTIGPDIPDRLVTADAPAAVLDNGHVLIAVSPALYSDRRGNVIYPSPTTFYSYDPVANAFSQVNGPTGTTDPIPSGSALMLALPDGSILYSHFGPDLYVYTPSGVPLATGKPTISSVALNPDGVTFHLTGTGLNGLSEGASFGDDAQMSTNYPLVRVTDGANVFYARTYNWSSTGVQTGNSTVTTEYSLNGHTVSSSYNIQVVVNGFSSNPFPSSSIAGVAGACCSSTGACVFTTLSQCSEVFKSGTQCTPNPCPTPTGACCASLGVCSVLTISECSAQGGAYKGDSVGCSAGTCPPTCPTIATQPLSTVVCAGQRVALSLAASGTAPLSYQWRKNAQALQGATTAKLVIHPASGSDSGSYDCVVTNSCGSATSIPATLTVNSPPIIALQPQPVSVCAGSAAVFTVRAPGALPRAFQWRRNGVNISGATTNTLEILSPQVADAGAYDCVVSNSCGSTPTNPAALTVTGGAPVLTVQPQPQTVCAGSPVSLRVRAPSAGVKTFQWRRNGVDIPGATSNVLTINSASLGDTGRYACVVVNACGSTRSVRAALAVTDCSHGACCNAQFVCTATPQSACSGHWTANGACSPNPCQAPAALSLTRSSADASLIPSCSGQWLTQNPAADANGPIYAAVSWAPVNSGSQTPLLVVAGRFSQIDSCNASNIAAWDGAAWRTFGVGLNGPVYALLELDGELIAAGDFTSAGGTYCASIAAWNGTVWHALGLGLNGPVTTLVDFNGDLIAAGSFSIADTSSASGIARWDGQTWQPLGGGLRGAASSLAVYRSTLIAAGPFTAPNMSMAAWDGSGWREFAGGTDGPVRSLAVVNDRLFAAGSFTRAGRTPAGSIAAWDGAAWVSLGNGIESGVQAIAVCRGELFAASASPAAHSISRWDGTAWNPLIAAPAGTVTALTAYAGTLAVLGDFSAAPDLAHLTLAQWVPDAPAFSNGPADLTALAGGRACFSVGAVLPADEGVTIRWYHDGEPLPSVDPRVSGAAGPTLTISPLRPADAGLYAATASGPCASTTSAAAQLEFCTADFNSSGTVNIKDLFDYVASWLDRAPEASLGASGPADIQNLFDFLSRWFRGCD